MKTAIDRILAAEEEAKRQVVDVQQRARALLKSAEAQGEELRRVSRERAQAEAESLLQKASAEAESTGRQIVGEATARGEQILLRAERLDLAFLAQNIDRIAGIE